MPEMHFLLHRRLLIGRDTVSMSTTPHSLYPIYMPQIHVHYTVCLATNAEALAKLKDNEPSVIAHVASCAIAHA